MSHFLKFIFTIMVLSSNCTAIANDETITFVYGEGNSSCGALVEAFRQGSPNIQLNYQGRQYPTQAHTYQAWLAGFLSAYNMHGSKSGNVGQVTDIHGLMEWVHLYCKNNPTSSVVQASHALVQSLNSRAETNPAKP